MKSSARLLVILLVLMLGACATQQNHHDPIEGVNRVTDKVNDGIDRATLKPIARGYTAAVPKSMRSAVSNFYDNSTYINTVLNDFLQGKGQQGILDLFRFLINSTIGIGGLVDVASSMGLERHEEDFGQTLASWGVGQGAYIVYPFLGSNSVRKTPNFITATATDPLFWAGFVLAPYITIPFTALKYIDKRAQLLSASDMRDEMALDPYLFTREAWRQNRDYLIYDGHPPAKPAEKDDGFEDDGFEGDDFESDGFEEGGAEIDTPVSGPKAHIIMDRAPAPVSTQSTTPATTVGSAAAGSELPPQTLANDSATATSAAQAEASNPQAADKHYLLFLSSHATEAEAAAEQAHIADAGILSEIYPVMVNGKRWYRLLAGQYDDYIKARQDVAKFESVTGLHGAWVEIEQH